MMTPRVPGFALFDERFPSNGIKKAGNAFDPEPLHDYPFRLAY